MRGLIAATVAGSVYAVYIYVVIVAGSYFFSLSWVETLVAATCVSGGLNTAARAITNAYKDPK